MTRTPMSDCARTCANAEDEGTAAIVPLNTHGSRDSNQNERNDADVVTLTFGIGNLVQRRARVKW